MRSEAPGYMAKTGFHQILLIGAGALGSRHLQSMCALPALEIFVIEPDVHSRQRCLLLPQVSAYPRIKWYSSVAELPCKSFDVVILACSASPRFELAMSVLAGCKVRYMILEKVVFQHTAHFFQFTQAIEASCCKVFVNCPRRLYPFYQALKPQLDSPAMHMVIRGTNWGLACNSIHFIDLMQWFSGGNDCRVDVSELEDIFPSKRLGYSEISGRLKVFWSDGSSLILDCRWHDTQPVEFEIEIRQQDKCFQIDELNQTCRLTDSGHSDYLTLDRMPFQSELTAGVIADLLQKDHCDLTPYAESTQLHLALLQPLSAWFAGKNPELSGICPIT